MTHWTSFLPELYTLLMAGCFLVLCLTRPNPRRDFDIALGLAAAGLIITLAAVGQRGVLFAGTYRIDLYSQVFKVIIYMGFFLIICLCSDLKGVAERRHSEFYFLLTVCTLAMVLLVSCVHLLTLYVALELSSYSL